MSNKPFKPRTQIRLTDHGQIKAYVHPARISILRMLAAEKMTVSSVARELGVHPANITHHFRRLEKAGLIKLVERRDIGKNIEKYYRAVARDFVLGFKKMGKTSKKSLALSILRDDLSAAVSTIRTDNDLDIIALIMKTRIQPEDLKELQQRLMAVIREFAGLNPEKGQAYTMNISVYPNTGAHIGQEKIIIEE